MTGLCCYLLELKLALSYLLPQSLPSLSSPGASPLLSYYKACALLSLANSLLKSHFIAA